MSRYWSDRVAGLEPYVPGEQPQDQNTIKLNTNESPYPPSPAVADLLRNFSADDLRRYPDPESRALVAALAGYHGVSGDQIFVGNGSDEVLAHAFLALLQKPAPIRFPDISYSFYPVYCALYGIDYDTVALDAGLQVDVDAYRDPCGGVVLPNPNAPTGIAVGLDALRRLLAAQHEVAVIIDEAYVDFGAESALGLIAEFDNLLIVRTFSKSRSLAGLRLGYALGSAPLIEALQRVKNSFNSYPVDRIACAAGVAALGDEAYFQTCRERIIASRERLAAELARLGFEVCPSTANFLLVRHPRERAAALYRALRDAGILVRHFDQPRIDDYLRISIGSDADCDALIATLEKILP